MGNTGAVCCLITENPDANEDNFSRNGKNGTKREEKLNESNDNQFSTFLSIGELRENQVVQRAGCMVFEPDDSPAMRIGLLTDEEQYSVEEFLRVYRFLSVNDRRMIGGKWGIFFYPLHKAVAKNDTEMVRLLLLAGAEKTKRDADKKTPLDLAHILVQDGRFLDMEIIKMLED